MTGYICCCFAASKEAESSCFCPWPLEDREERVVEIELSKGFEEVGVTGLVGKLAL